MAATKKACEKDNHKLLFCLYLVEMDKMSLTACNKILLVIFLVNNVALSTSIVVICLINNVALSTLIM